MHSTTLLANKLRTDFPDLRFTANTDFHWSPDERTVYYNESSDDAALLLHELAHAVLKHADYTRDIELIEMERDAWDHARTVLAPRYSVPIDDAIIEDSLDTYRDWLHARSTCPDCQAIGIQIKLHHYRCLACGAQWKVNDARICALRRYKLSK